MISEEQIAHYWDQGWVVVEGVFTAKETEEIAAIVLEVSQRLAEASGDPYLMDTGAGGVSAPRKIVSPFIHHPTFRAFTLDHRLHDAIQAILNAEPLLCGDQVFMKPPNFGTAKPYHQDNFYFLCTPADHVITAWIALDDVDEANGCLRYIDRSHRDGLLPHTEVPGEPYNLAPEPTLIDLSREALAPVRKGGVVFHHSETLHTSHRNTSDRWRRGYATHWVTADVTSRSTILDAAYFKRPDYTALVEEASVSTESP